jgi:hypothetical protein
MIRTVWLAAFCLAGLGGLCASKVTASISQPEDDIPDSVMVSTGVAPDTLTAADKVDLTGIRPTAEAALAQLNDPAVIPAVKFRRTRANGLVRQIDTKASMIAVLPKPRPKVKISKDSNAPKLAGDLKKCPQPDGLAAIITSLTGASRCG